MNFRFLSITLCTLVLFSCDKDESVQANNAPTMENQTFSASEASSPVDNIGTLKASDADNDRLRFSIVADENDFFVISDRGTISVANGQKLNYDTAKSHEITVCVTDGTDSSSATITIIVTSANQSPTMTSFTFDADEDINDTYVIGNVTAQDADEGDTLFEISEDGELSLKASQNLDYETATSHSLTVSVTDGESSVETKVIILVNNVIEMSLVEDPNSFVITFNDNDGQPVSIGTVSNLNYNYFIDWGDGSPVEEIKDSTPPEHVYNVQGTYTVAINGLFPGINMSQNASSTRLTSIDQWGSISWESFKDAFRGCINLTHNAIDSPNLSKITSTAYMFVDATSFNGDLSGWNVSTVTDMSSMFNGASSFNGNISGWEVANVEKMINMFSNATSFNQNLGEWDISNVTTMVGMLDNSGLSPSNYGNTLIGWDNQETLPVGITLGALNLKYCGDESIAARTHLGDSKEWNIEGDFEECEE